MAGQLGWLDLWSALLSTASTLWARWLCMPSTCTARVVRFAVTQPSSWAAAIQSKLQQIGVPDPSSWGIAPNAPRTVMHRWLQHAQTLICSHAFAHFQAVGQGTDSLLQYLYWQPTPHLHPIVYGRQTRPSQARSWGLARCGHHDFSDRRSARHRHADPSAPCRFCAVGIDSFEHALLTAAHTKPHARAGCNSLVARSHYRYTGSSAPTLASTAHVTFRATLPMSHMCAMQLRHMNVDYIPI